MFAPEGTRLTVATVLVGLAVVGWLTGGRVLALVARGAPASGVALWSLRDPARTPRQIAYDAPILRRAVADERYGFTRLGLSAAAPARVGPDVVTGRRTVGGETASGRPRAAASGVAAGAGVRLSEAV